MSCDAQGLSLTQLSAYDNGVINSYGVRGCNQQAVYVLSSNGVWLLNNAPPPK